MTNVVDEYLTSSIGRRNTSSSAVPTSAETATAWASIVASTGWRWSSEAWLRFAVLEGMD